MFKRNGKVLNKHLLINKKKYIKEKIIVSIFIFIFIFTMSSLANIDDDEEINLDEIEEEVIETSSQIETEPTLNSRIALVYDRTSGNVIYEKNGYKTVPMASTTKIMTAIVVLENANLQDTVTVEKKAAGTGGSRLGLKVGDKITVNDLLYGLLLRSGNDAAVALAIHVGGSIEGFATLMNQKANELNLNNTNFETPHGLDSKNHYTTAYELAKMADYALKKEKFKKIVGTQNCNITISGVQRNISNTNELLGYLNGVYGVKTGFTNGAGRCLVTACKRDNLDIITVVLGADTKKIRTSDSIKLIEYIYNNFEMVNIQEKVNEKFNQWKEINKNRISINKGVTNNMKIDLEEMQFEEMPINKKIKDNIEIKVNTIFNFDAPVEEGKIIGNLKIFIDDNEIQTLNIYNTENIRKKEIKDYIKQFMYVIKYE